MTPHPTSPSSWEPPRDAWTSRSGSISNPRLVARAAFTAKPDPAVSATSASSFFLLQLRTAMPTSSLHSVSTNALGYQRRAGATARRARDEPFELLRRTPVSAAPHDRITTD